MAIKAWDMLGGEIDWAALPLIAELLGIVDIEMLINQLILIRNFNRN